jgi:hypothetical protein
MLTIAAKVVPMRSAAILYPMFGLALSTAETLA